MDENKPKTEGKCPVMHGGGRTPTNRDWWPNQLNLRVLHPNPPASDPMGEDFHYAEAFKALDLAALVVELQNHTGKDPFADGFVNFEDAATLIALYSR